MPKNFLLFFLTLAFLFIVNALSVSAGNNECATLFKSNCNECHDMDRGCELLGQPPEEWTKLFEFMEAMGADIPDDEKSVLLDCLNRHDEGVKTTCSK